MDKKIFLVTGATGDTGRETTRVLLERQHRVRAFVHRQDERSEALAQLGAEIFVGDLLNFADVQNALREVNAAYFVYPVAAGIVQATAYFAEAAREAGSVQLVVNMSQLPARSDAKSFASLNHWIAEQVFDWSGIGVAHLRPTLFTEWLLYTSQMVATEGVLRLPFENGKHAPIAAEDQARVIASILANPDAHLGQTYQLFGATELTFEEIAGEMSIALGREIRYEPLKIEEFARFLRGAGRDEFLIQHAVEITKDYRNGIFSGMNDLVSIIGGKEPLTVREFVAKNQQAFGKIVKIKEIANKIPKTI